MFAEPFDISAFVESIKECPPVNSEGKSPKNITQKDKSLLAKYRRRIFVKAENINNILGLNLPNCGETVHVVTNGKHIDALAFCQNVIDKVSIKTLTIVTYSIRKKTITCIGEWLLQEKLQSAMVAVSCHIKTLNKLCYEYMLQMQKEVPALFKLKMFHNHAKIALMHTSDDNYYVLEGSGNFSENALVEQYQLTNCKELYDFHLGWIFNQRDEYV